MGFLSCRTSLVLCVAVMFAGRASAQAVSFSQPKLYPTGLGPEQVAVADFNLVSILLAKGDGTFSAPVNTPLGTSPKAILVADFNGDGRPDVFTDSYDGNTGSWSLWVLPGRGDGTFGVPLHPVYPGLYLVYFKIPAGVPKGNMVPIQLSINGLSTDPANVTIAVQ
jgi:hypothetical protein